jgi:predicted nucleic acid-binding protein
MAVVLDTRFLIAHTFPSTAHDRDRIASFSARVSTEGLLASSLSIVEFMKVAGARIGRDAAATRLRIWKKGGLEFVAVSEEIGFLAGELAQSNPDIPLGDTVIAATARAASAAVATDDPHYSGLGVKTLWFK